MLEGLADACIVLDREWRCVYANRRAATLLRRPFGESAGQELRSVLPPALASVLRAAGEGALSSGRRIAIEWHDEASGAYWEVTLHPSAGGLLVLFQDAGARHDLLSLIDHSPDITTRYDRELRVLFMSAAVERATGMPVDAFVGRRVDETGLPPELTARWRRRLNKVFATGQEVEDEFEYTGPEGRRVYQAWVTPERGESGAVVSVLTTTRDVTALRRAEAAAREAAETSQSLLEQTLTGIFVIQDGRYTYVNPRFAEIFGYTVEEILGLPDALALVAPGDRELARARIQARLDGAEAMSRLALRGLRKDGTMLWVAVFGSAAWHEGRPAIIGMMLDTTAEHEAVERLRQSEKRFRALVEHASDLIAIFGMEGNALYASPSHQAVLGYSADEITRMFTPGLVHPDDVAYAMGQFDAVARQGGTVAMDRPVRMRHADGSWRSLAMILTDLRDDPAVRGLVLNSRDVTEELALEAQLRRAQQMELLGQLAGGVAHDFNNVLAAIMAYAQLVREDLPAGHAHIADLDEILKAAGRAATIIRQLLAFSRRQAVETQVVDLGAVVRETGGMLRPLLPASIEPRITAPDETDPAWVRADRAQLEQMIMNLAVNARDAMPRGGRLEIVVTTPPEDEPPEAVLQVRDTGVGMSPEVLEHVFEPFFTTKEPGRGTGLGLATVYGIVRQFGGTIDVESTEGAGCTVTVRLPRVAAPPVPESAAAPPLAAPARRHTVLLVEDEEPIRRSASRLLERAGYEVLAAPNGAVALALLEVHGDVVDLVLTDAAMPVMGGRELALRVAEVAPGLPVLLMSGYAELAAGESDERQIEGIAAFIQKPFTMQHLIGTVRAVLADNANGPSS